MALEDVIATKLLSISEHHLRYETLLAMSRALREKVDWHQVRERTGSSPFARAFFVLLDGLGIVSAEEIEGPAPEASPASQPAAPPGASIRVLTDPASGSAARVAG